MNAALIGPAPEDGVVLDELEHETLKGALRLARLEGDNAAQAIAHALRNCDEQKCEDRGGVLPRFLHETMEALGTMSGQHIEYVRGLVVQLFRQPVLLLEEQGDAESETIRDLLQILRRRDWLAGFLSDGIPRWAQEPVTPLAVTWEAAQHAISLHAGVQDAKALQAQWPQFFESAEQCELQEVQ